MPVHRSGSKLSISHCRVLMANKTRLTAGNLKPTIFLSVTGTSTYIHVCIFQSLVLMCSAINWGCMLVKTVMHSAYLVSD